MANIFTNTKVNDDAIRMSNGLTSVFIETFCLAGSDIAKEEFQKDIMIWFGQRDWAICGMGLEGFDVSEIIWSQQNFDEQKSFILSVINRVFEQTNWNLLSYQPNKEWLFDKLQEFKTMISGFNVSHIDEAEQVEIFDFDGEISKYGKCEKHHIYKHFHGCVICNNEVNE